MKILQLVEATAAGVGRHVMDLADGLLSRGQEVHLLYSDLRSDKVFADDLRRLNLRAGFQAFRIPLRRELCTADIPAMLVLRQYVQCHGPFDLVHCHSTKAGLVGRVGLLGLSLKRLYTPHMFYTMDNTRGRLARRAVATLEAALSKCGHGVVVVSRQEHAHARELGIAHGKLCLIPNGVVLNRPALSTAERVTLRRKLGLRDAEVCIGFVGRLVPVKSPETMLRSFAALRDRVELPTRLVMVGDGPLAEALRRLSASLGIEAHVSWLGERDAKGLMEVFDIFALTSDSEGHPLVALEAMARGLPVVATAVGGIAETVFPGVNGFIASVRGVSEIAAALAALVLDLALRERMGQASLAISRDFSVDRMVDQTIAFYDQVVFRALSGISEESKVPALH